MQIHTDALAAKNGHREIAQQAVMREIEIIWTWPQPVLADSGLR
jgi:hypothetical protein